MWTHEVHYTPKEQLTQGLKEDFPTKLKCFWSQVRLVSAEVAPVLTCFSLVYD